MHLVERMQVAVIGLVNAYIDRVMRELEPGLRARFDKADPFSIEDVTGQVSLGEGFLKTTFRAVDRQAAEDLSRVVPVPSSSVLKNSAKLEAGWIQSNTELIKLEARARAEIRGVISGPLREGVRVEEVRAKIQERLNVVRSRAEFIARDQTLKLYGQIQEARQTEAGITEYTWSTSEDERVRPDHEELDGTTQRWDSPPIVDKRTGRREHPGKDFQCRCAGIPILPLEGLEEPENPREPTTLSQPPPENDLVPEPETPPVDVEAERRAAEAEAARVAAEERRLALQAEAEAKAAKRQEEARKAEADRLAVAERKAAGKAAREAKKQAQLQETMARLRAQEEARLLAEREAFAKQAAEIAARKARPVPLVVPTPLQVAQGFNDSPVFGENVKRIRVRGPNAEAHRDAVYDALDRAGFKKFWDTPGRRLDSLTVTDLSSTAASSTGTALGDVVEGGAGGLAYTGPVGRKYGGEAIKVRSPGIADRNPANPQLVQVLGSTTDYAATAEEASARLAVHEFGHIVHENDQVGTAHVAINELISRAFYAARESGKNRVSHYGMTNHQEYFAEAFGTYHSSHKAWLRDNAPGAFEMVEAVLRLRGLL
jgi:SPP1 gp7 family putative phage head morphogenesis protein